ncbi:MAG: TldD/PmbA family protein [Tepidiformaceae bacterium]
MPTRDDDLLNLARHVVERAKAHGAAQCDVYAGRYDESNVSVRVGEVEKLIEAGSRALGLRVITDGGRTAVSSTSDLSEDALERLAKETVELAAISEADPHAGLPDPGDFAQRGAEGLQLYDERLGDLTTDAMTAMAIASEDAARGYDSRITNSGGASVSARRGEVALVNSLGFSGTYPSTGVSLSVEVMADDEDGKKRNAYWFTSERSLHRLQDAAEVGRIAARRALDQLGARKVTTRLVPVVFEPMMTAALMRDFAGCANGSALYRGSTFLAGRTGQAIGSPLVSIVDDPWLPARGGSRPFDGEGVGTRKTSLLEAGVFQGFLFDSYSARRTESRTTGSAHRGVDSLPSPGSSNLVFEAGATAPEEIIGDVKDGLYLTALLGFGFNPATGDYSRGAAGMWIENGRIAFPVTEINISGRLDSMLADIDAVGADLAWFGGSAAPTVRVREMTVSGL